MPSEDPRSILEILKDIDWVRYNTRDAYKRREDRAIGPACFQQRKKEIRNG